MFNLDLYLNPRFHLDQGFAKPRFYKDVGFEYYL